MTAQNVAKTNDKPVTLSQLIASKQAQYQTLLPNHIPPERFMRIIFTQVAKNPKLLECTQESVLAAVLTAAELGLIPDGKRGALVPFNNKIKGVGSAKDKWVMQAQFMPMYQGLIELARNSGYITDIFPATICEKDEFTFELGLNRNLHHVPSLRDRGNPIGYYAVVEFKDGTKTFGPGPMSVPEIELIRNISKAKDSNFWKNHYEAMAWKTVIKRVLKFCPASNEQNDRLGNAVTLDGEFDKDFGADLIDIDAYEIENKQISDVKDSIQIEADKKKSKAEIAEHAKQTVAAQNATA